MTDRELIELLVSKFDNMENKMGSMETKMGSMETDIKEIKIDLIGVKDQTTILTEFRDESYNRFDALEQKLDEIEAKNAERHVIINSNVISI